MFSTVLIANRGEIALRVARTCREMGIRTVAVCSDSDRESAVTRFADECVRIGPAAPRRSYLNAAAIVTAALQTGADAVHPGYGFLSEDPDFAEICEAEGLAFIGAPASLLGRLGDKAQAREIAQAAGLPVLPGSSRSLATLEQARSVADEIGYPVIIKATAGGGGRGMTVVRDPRDFPRAWGQARTGAQLAFGDPRLYLEAFLDHARHIEVQILGDGAGKVIQLGERDCSVQRRRQKLIEETPAPGLPRELADRICAAAVHAAREVRYAGAGTYEFLVDGDDFYFMEVNCRIQVEHPVTEMVTGIDLIREQLRVAAGDGLSIGQEDVAPRGVSIECRVNAEDPRRGFLPTPGTVTEFLPPSGPFVRVDTHGYPGFRVTADYDPLLAKVAVWAPDRRQAIARADRALEEFRIQGRGMHTTTDFLREVLENPVFRAAKHTTGLVDNLGTGA
ncbi:acetyl-CoA carboxylase biotin carboxylase subunit [Microtetraspora sp. NBRC 13810]|uniref:acetyl-CoA carboxylase biotin carboxylase subunit n=1 Tax=Microtetraspora sp. NBRC 13810 TaxID=3030990 RepID=UPI0024A4162E|nr:biotin carboxylase N-terminal domain-containing protein [Microtetraspora sp. NBRC 13810]GLW06806.1 acetyl-CoA carboxylase biotin carboxylase subunit [Microtetraspora sp. NBRC 13810]